MSKQQPVLQQQAPLNLEMNYHSPINMGEDSNMYSEQMKKYIEAMKMYRFQLMNSQMNPTFNPNIPASLNPALHPQYGMQMQMPNPYINYPGNPSFGAFDQFKNLSHSLPPNSMPFGMSPFSAPPNISSLYPTQYVNPYSNPMASGFGQTPPHSLIQMMGMQKNDVSPKVYEYAKQPKINNTEAQKRYSVSQSKHVDQQLRNDKQKSLQKESKTNNSVSKTPFNVQTQNLQPTKIIQNLLKPASDIDFLPKKLLHKDTKILVEQDPIFKSCACKGYFQYETSFTCVVCKNKFHYQCLGLSQNSQDYTIDQVNCAHCKMRGMDPLNRVVEKIGEFYMMNLFEKSFECVLNFRPYEAKFREKNSKFDIQIRCIRSGQHMKNLEITWPDECQLKLNGQKILDIPALQSNSSLKKRKDFTISITHNIYSKSSNSNQIFLAILEKVKMMIEMKPITVEQANTKRIKNDYTFALGVYLVEKLSVDDLVTKVMNEQKVQDKSFMKNLMKTSENEVQIDKITIKLLDPYSWDYIKTPVRGHKCTHAQCFDLKTFISLMYSAKNRTWKCPLCSRDCRKFMLDTEQMQLIKKAHEFEPIPKEVSVYKQGKVAFKIQRDDSFDDGDNSTLQKTKKISKPKKQQSVKQK